MTLEDTQHDVIEATVTESNPGAHDVNTADPSEIHKAKDMNLICCYGCDAEPQMKIRGKVIRSQSCTCNGVVVVNPFTLHRSQTKSCVPGD